LIILFALIALAVSTPAEKKPAEKAEKAENKETANDEKKPAKKPADDKKDDERKGLVWPLPDPIDEGDLMLHGAHLFDRVEELHKGKLDKEEDKMILSVGREYLRLVHKYIEKNTDFKIPSVLCRDSDRMNSTDRWEIRLQPGKQQFNAWFNTDGQTQQKQQTEQQATKQQNDAAQSKETKQNDQIVPSNNSTHENVTENLNATESSSVPSSKDHPNFETIRKEYYKRMGDNFARVLLKRYRKEKLEKEETEYLNRWVADESIHYGMMGIFCHDGENVKDITKRLATVINDKP